MRTRNIFASILAAAVLGAWLPAHWQAADAAPGGQPSIGSGKSMATSVTEVKKRGRGPRIYRRIAPSYLYYDYPYYYHRGFYPTHIRPGFIYYGFPYSYYTSRSRAADRCSHLHRPCAVARGKKRGARSARSMGACRCR